MTITESMIMLIELIIVEILLNVSTFDWHWIAIIDFVRGQNFIKDVQQILSYTC